MKTSLIYLNLYYYITCWGVKSQTTDTIDQSTGFTCEDGKEIDYLDVCDGIVNCKDASDEKCDSQAILFYYTTEVQINIQGNTDCRYRYEDYLRSYGLNDDNFYNFMRNYGCLSEISERSSLNVSGIFLNDDKEFSVIVQNDSSRWYYERIERLKQNFENVTIGFNGPEIYISYSNETGNFSKRVTRHNIVSGIPTRSRKERIKSPVMDWVTANLYYISNSQIKVCDQNLVVCVNLQSKFIKNPSFLAISVKHRLLFWTDIKSQFQVQLFKYPLNKDTKPTLIRQDLKSPKWLTIDSFRDRVYWLDDRNDGLKFYSSTFEGTDVVISSRGISIPVNTSSFAVFDGSVYWPDIDQNNIMKCSILDCEIPKIVKKNIFARSDIPFKNISSMGYLTIDHRPVLLNQNKDPCDHSTCSHLCVPATETTYNCHCNGFDQPVSSNMYSGYCSDDTLIATYQNSLFVVGLLNDDFSTPIIYTNRINISSISTVTYNPLDGSIILTESGRQKIYSWKPKINELELILDDGFGTIYSIEFDNRANNLYWIDPKTHTMKVMNMYSHLIVNILVGNSSYSPVKFTLVPAKGRMIVLFVKESQVVVIERISMDGDTFSRRIIFTDEEAASIDQLTLHYMEETRLICLLDGQTNDFKYFPDSKKNELRDLTNKNNVGNIKSFTSLRDYLIWSEDDLTIRRATVDTTVSQINPAQKISLRIEKIDDLDSKTSEKSFVKITNVLKRTAELSSAKCLEGNGGCEKMCLSTSKLLKFACFCPEGETLVNDTLCRKLETAITGTATESTSRVLDGNILKLSTKNYADIQITTPLQQTKLTSPTSQSACVKSCPVCHNQQSQNPLHLENRLTEQCASSSSISSGLYIFYAAFIVILVVFLGFVAGYIFRGKLSEHRRIRLVSNSGTLELSAVEPGNESTITSNGNA